MEHLRGEVHHRVVRGLVRVALAEGAITQKAARLHTSKVREAKSVLRSSLHDGSPKYMAALETLRRCSNAVERARATLATSARAHGESADVAPPAIAPVRDVLLLETTGSLRTKAAMRRAGRAYLAKTNPKLTAVKTVPGDHGKAYAVANFRGVLWVGGVCVYAAPSEWSILQVCGSQRVVVVYTDEDSVVRRAEHVLASWKATSRPCTGTLLSVQTFAPRTCSPTARDLDAAYVEHVRPYHKLLYASHGSCAPKALALVRSDHTLVCAGCGATFGTNTRALAAHVGFSRRLEAVQWRVHQVAAVGDE